MYPYAFIGFVTELRDCLQFAASRLIKKECVVEETIVALETRAASFNNERAIGDVLSLKVC